MIRIIEISIVIALTILANTPARAIAFTPASNPERRETQDASCADSMLVASSTPDGNAITPLEVHDSLETAIVPFFLRQQNGTEALSNVLLSAYLYGESGAVETGVVFSFKSRGQDVSSGGVTVPTGSGEVPIEMSISNLKQDGVYTIRLFEEHAGQTECLSDVSLTRLEAPELFIVGSDADGAITLNRTVTNFQHPFRIASENQTQVNDLKIVVGDFVDPDGNWVTTTQNPSEESAPYTLGGNSEIVLNVTADLPQEGEYTSTITLYYAGKREDTALKVNRNPPTTTVEARPLGTIQGNYWPMSIFPQSNADIEPKTNTDMEIVLTSTDPRPVTIESVEPIRLERLQGEDGKVNVLADLVFELKSSDQDFVVNSSNPLTLTYSITGLNQVGTYEGDLMVGVVDAQPPAVVPFTIQLKASGWWAGFVIGGSILLSWIYRLLYGTRLPYLRNQKLANESLGLLEERKKEYEHKVRTLTINPGSKLCMTELFSNIQGDLIDVMTSKSNVGAEPRLDTARKKLELVPQIVRTLYVIKDDNALQNQLWQEKVQTLISAETITEADSNQLIAALSDLHKRARGVVQPTDADEGIDNVKHEDLKESARRIDRGILAIEGFAFIVALILAIFIGLQLLWEPNQTWGSFGDIVVAVLWGFGLYQASTAATIPLAGTFLGLPDLAKKIGSPAN